MWSQKLVCLSRRAVSRHYSHYFASAFVQETAVTSWAGCEVAGPGDVLVQVAKLAVTWWLLAEFCAELHICDNCQRRWPVLPLPLSLFLFCVYIFPSSIFPCLLGLGGQGEGSNWPQKRKSGEKRELLMPPDQFLLPDPISITATSAGTKVMGSSEHLAPPSFLRSVGSICLWTSPRSVTLTTTPPPQEKCYYRFDFQMSILNPITQTKNILVEIYMSEVLEEQNT